MPELPEVEITRRRIAPLLLGRRLARVHTTRPSYVFLTPPARLRRELRGRRFEQLERHGKYLLGLLDDGRRLLIHLGMTGQLFGEGASSLRLLSASSRSVLSPEQQPAFVPDRHTHLRLEFDDAGPQVLFRDTRKFGKLKLIAAGRDDPRLARLGPDALEASGEQLQRAARGRRCALKALLLDQSVLAGVGNIYADEALYLSGLRPTRGVARTSLPGYRRLAAALKRVLERSIETGGSSISDYVAPDGEDGRYQDERHVYARTGLPCRVCGRAIKRVLVAQRSSHYCPACQR